MPFSTQGKQRVLLRLVEAMHLVHEEDGALAVLAATLLGRRHHLAHLVHARQDGIEGDKVGTGGIGDDASPGLSCRCPAGHRR